MYYYSCKGAHLVSLAPLDGFGSLIAPAMEGRLFAPVPGDAVLDRGSFRIDHPRQLLVPHGLEVLDASRLTEAEVDGPTLTAIAEGRLIAINTGRPGWEELLTATPKSDKRQVNLLAIGDVGSTLLTRLKLLGGDVISSIGICDLSDQITVRWEFKMGQVALPQDYDALSEVEIVSPDHIFDCNVFAFVTPKGAPPVGSQVKDVRMAQFEANASIVKHYARIARDTRFQGLWCAVSDPVDPLAKTVYLESNRDESGVWDDEGLRLEQIQGFGLGVVNVRAAHYAKRDVRLSSFLSEGCSFGPHGTGLFIANFIQNYDEVLSQELTHLTVTANLKMRELDFKPYAAPALSSGTLSLLFALRGEWRCGSVLLDGIYMGAKNRFTTAGIETELLPYMPDALFGHIRETAQHLKEIL